MTDGLTIKPLLGERFDCVVIGAGHGGCEAALAAARMGLKTALLTLNLDSIGMMPCNPSIGGTGKGHLVRELDAMGGEMGLAADDTLIQMRMLNTGKGPAVHSLRAQMDKRRYHERMKAALEHEDNLTLIQSEAVDFITEGGRILFEEPHPHRRLRPGEWPRGHAPERGPVGEPGTLGHPPQAL